VAPAGYPFFFQLYVNKHKLSSELLLRRVWDLGIRTLFLTVDAPVPGKREADERVRIDGTLSTPMSGTTAANDRAGSGLTRTMGTYIDPSLNWEHLVWLRNSWKGKVVVKGIQAAEDAKKAAEEGVDGIVLRYGDDVRLTSGFKS
jgi:L-lactate dehydrogenase (cytochrome)